MIQLLIDEDYETSTADLVAENIGRNLILMKDATVFNLKLFANASEKSCSKYGIKQLKGEKKERLFEMLSKIMFNVIKFLNEDYLDEKM